MKGVLLKDLYIAKSNIFVMVVGVIALGLGISYLLEISALLVLAPVFFTMTVFVSITSDASSKWDKNVITMPVSRKQIIGEKYTFYMILAVLGIFAALIPCGILALFGSDITLGSLCLYGSIGMIVTLLTGSISLPCAYIFEPEKSQIVFMMSCLATTGIITAPVLLANMFISVKDNIFLVFHMLLLMAAIGFFVSYKIAVRVYLKRDIT